MTDSILTEGRSKPISKFPRIDAHPPPSISICCSRAWRRSWRPRARGRPIVCRLLARGRPIVCHAIVRRLDRRLGVRWCLKEKARAQCVRSLMSIVRLRRSARAAPCKLNDAAPHSYAGKHVRTNCECVCVKDMACTNMPACTIAHSRVHTGTNAQAHIDTQTHRPSHSLVHIRGRLGAWAVGMAGNGASA